MNPLQKSSAFLIISILLIITSSPLRVISQKTLTETEVVVTTIQAPDVTVVVPPPDANPTETVIIGQPKEPAKAPGPAPAEEPKAPVPNEQPKEQPKEPQEPKVTPPPQSKSPPEKQSDSTNSSKSGVVVLTGSAPTPTNLGNVNIVEWNLIGVSIIVGGLITFFMNAWVL
ncbi:17209_t:CDS:2 [Funneliformis caledonium]|uniref:17209_t:CDS:1 n=1 Tax=Funneliformis caledonium TaxID=1117310 RepID=A0A9N9F7W9_9GLOM|nr:17209_t:CDS:2 [Funneliformis caledonium]